MFLSAKNSINYLYKIFFFEYEDKAKKKKENDIPTTYNTKSKPYYL